MALTSLLKMYLYCRRKFAFVLINPSPPLARGSYPNENGNFVRLATVALSLLVTADRNFIQNLSKLVCAFTEPDKIAQLKHIANKHLIFIASSALMKPFEFSSRSYKGHPP